MLDQESLLASSVVANCAMNRERELIGSNGYSFELKFDIKVWLQQEIENRPLKWLDVCCGTGKALVEAAQIFDGSSHQNRLSITGIDLAGHFYSHSYPNLELCKTSVETWDNECRFDLITIVHGLHYIGDKLGVIRNLANRLESEGVFLANIDLANLKFSDGRSAGRAVLKRLRENGFRYDNKNRLITFAGGRKIDSFDFNYLGADDRAGPNFTGQPAVNSYYDVAAG